ncbi:N-6 DNA methylase [Candidatus Poribacteria bacterium]|nr:N-6 DNA methylase [Candidatus Poribacteria bacterium]MYG07923.1 N-6 DNA methylase [Candidatus Poribacteria bacterium]MYK24107.1 N-6 DNA methylase [Candidatus Poribacteria bacterium]
MPPLNIKPTHKPIKNYYTELEAYAKIGVEHEGAVRTAFQTLLQHYCRQGGLILVCEKTRYTKENRRIQLDGEVVDAFDLPHGHYEAKDTQDDLLTEARRKSEAGYPFKNIIIQSPTRALLYQNGHLRLDHDLTDPKNLIELLNTFFAYQEENIVDWYAAVEEFREKVPVLGRGVAQRVETEMQDNQLFRQAFTNFHDQCRAAIDPNLTEAQVEEMLIQHLLTERIFRTVFDNPDFTNRNIIAQEIEKVIHVLTQRSPSRSEFLRPLNPFYIAIEKTAATITDFSQKQSFLNTVYEQFFQGFSVKIADTHGIVYTPQPIVDFMVKSVEHVLKTEFGRSLSDMGVHIIDPFVGTGNFIVRLMQEIQGRRLPQKYREELHCNEVMLLPYYIASLNIEHAYFERMGSYEPFPHICFVDTFDTVDLMDAPHQTGQFSFFTPENTLRVEEQRETRMFVVIGNPPYNARQDNENDNNRNREHVAVDTRVRNTFAADSKAQSKNKLYDPYVKAFRWAMDKLGDEGIVAFVTNNSFIDAQMFDGMRKHLSEEFDTLYILDLGGNVRKGQPGDANVFGIQVGVSLNILVKSSRHSPRAVTDKGTSRIFYNDETTELNKARTFAFLDENQHIGNIEWQELTPDRRHTWLTANLHTDFDTFIPIGSKEAKAGKGKAEGTLFKTYSLGVSTNRDAWVYNFNTASLTENIQRMIKFYNAQTLEWVGTKSKSGMNLDDFVDSDPEKISWSEGLKRKLKAGQLSEFAESKLRQSLYRPFTKTNLFFDRMVNERVYVFPSIFPTLETESENRILCVNMTPERPFACLMSDCIPVNVMAGGFGSPTQCFPFYTYDEDGTNRRENITDWASMQFQKHYEDETITKWDIFHYTYGLLHHPDYREKYQENLKRDLPHIPFAEDFYAFTKAGARLANLHVNYESQPEYDKLEMIETPGMQVDLRVDRMKLSKDKARLSYNDFLTLEGIPPEVFDYRLGNRSALEWVVDQYRVKVDKRSGLVNNPNREEDAEYIVRLIGQVITVSLETIDIVKGLPALKS